VGRSSQVGLLGDKPFECDLTLSTCFETRCANLAGGAGAHTGVTTTMALIDFITLETRESPKEVLERDFPDIAPLPIRGGWGYDQETACIIEPPADPGTPFDGVEVEYIFAEHRLYEELMFFSPIELGYEDISCRLLLQELISEGDRYYDVLKIEVFARPVERAEMLSSARGTARRRRRPPVHTGEREFWFDITSFFGSDKLA
jgi:hypothetical protein